jgi:hypothetical protein
MHTYAVTFLVLDLCSGGRRLSTRRGRFPLASKQQLALELNMADSRNLLLLCI